MNETEYDDPRRIELLTGFLNEAGNCNVPSAFWACLDIGRSKKPQDGTGSSVVQECKFTTSHKINHTLNLTHTRAQQYRVSSTPRPSPSLSTILQTSPSGLSSSAGCNSRLLYRFRRVLVATNDSEIVRCNQNFRFTVLIKSENW
jgi:hypothetical protein